MRHPQDYRSDTPAIIDLEALRGIRSERRAALWAGTKSDIVRELALTRHRASTDERILQLTYLRTQSLDKEICRAL